MIARVLLAGLLFSTLTVVASENTFAQSRIAFVVGNGAYANVKQLHNPPNDAADISQSLQRLGFSVTSITDATLDSLRHALIDFGRAARDADTAVLFFAGHGMEILIEKRRRRGHGGGELTVRDAGGIECKAAWPRYSRRLQEQSIFWQNAPAR